MMANNLNPGMLPMGFPQHLLLSLTKHCFFWDSPAVSFVLMRHPYKWHCNFNFPVLKDELMLLEANLMLQR